MHVSRVVMLAGALAFALPGVAYSASTGPEGVEWHLLTLGDAAVPTLPGGRQPSLRLDPGRKKAGGFAGCNNFFASYELAGAALKFGPLGATRKACADVDPTVEARYLEALGRTGGWRIDGGELLLVADGAVLARFAGSPLDSPMPELETLRLRSKVYTAGPVTLTRGEFRASAAPGSVAQVTVRLTGQRAFATLGGRGTGVIVVATSLGGSGGFYELALLVRQGDGWANTDTVILGDRVKVQSVVIQDGAAVVALVEHGPKDPRCCPTVAAGRRYAIQGERLVPAAGGAAAGQPSLTGPVWQWVQTRYNDDRLVAPAMPEKYTVRFRADGWIDVQADCNRKGGNYTLDGKRVSITILNSTMAACEPGSLEDSFVRDLTAATNYFFKDGRLYVDLKYDTGTMTFSGPPQ